MPSLSCQPLPSRISLPADPCPMRPSAVSGTPMIVYLSPSQPFRPLECGLLANFDPTASLRNEVGSFKAHPPNVSDPGCENAIPRSSRQVELEGIATVQPRTGVDPISWTRNP